LLQEASARLNLIAASIDNVQYYFDGY